MEAIPDEFTFENYVEAAGETAVYDNHLTSMPGVGESGSPIQEVRFGYLIAGLNDEAQELVDSVDAGWFSTALDGTVGELGDVLWYNARLHNRVVGASSATLSEKEMAFSLPRAAVSSADSLKELTRAVRAHAGTVSGLVKKTIRGDDGKLERAARALTMLEDMRTLLDRAAQEISRGLRLKDVARKNVEKLSSRQDRGVLKGDGDNR